MSAKRGAKKHHTQVGQDFFALGANTASTSSLERLQNKLPAKRNEPFQAPISLSPKRQKLNSPLQSSSSSSSSSVPSSSLGQSASSSKSVRSWEEKAIVVPATELKDKILQLDSESESEEMVEMLLCGAAKQLREQKTKPDSCLIFTLIYLAKIRPLFFCSNVIVNAFSSLLKREHLINYKAKNSMVPVLIINLFYYAYHDENSWPESFVKLYVEDSLGDRIWVDNEECKDFVETILASFHTKLPPKSLLQTTDVLNPIPKHIEVGSSPSLLCGSEDSIGEESCSSSTSILYEAGKDSSSSQHAIPISRYIDNEEKIKNYVYEIVNEHLNRRTTMGDISRNMLKLLIATSGLRNIRLLVAQKLEHWFQNPKLSRPAQDLLLTVFLNCDDKDIETLSHLLKMRLKNKPFVSHFVSCFKELLQQRSGTFELVLRILLNNELTGIRNLNNIQLISIMFQHNPNDATIILAKIYFSVIYTREDHLRLRNLLREIVRAMKSEPMNYLKFINSLIEEARSNMTTVIDNECVANNQFNFALRDKVVCEIVDIITMCIFLSVNQNVRESFARPERKEIMRAFQMKISSIKCKTISWIYEVATLKSSTRKLPFKASLFIGLVKKVLILESGEVYCRIDNWPSENERIIIFRLTSECIPLQEETVQRILYMGFNPDVPMQPRESCEIIWTLINCATINFDGDMNYPVLLFKDLNILNLLFDCCSFICPDNVTFPPNYIKPKLAMVELYWQVWFMSVIIGAHIPSIFGTYAWKNFPMFQALIEMGITNNFQFPPKSMDTDEMRTKIMQMNQLEKVKILEFESYWSQDKEVNEAHSLLLPKLVFFDPTSEILRPPSNQILEDFKLLCTSNSTCRLSHLLCQSRDPDFLLMVIHKQQSHPGSNSYFSSLNWLIDLVESYENNYGLLPVQCLCEFYLKQIAEETSISSSLEISKMEKARKKDKRRKLLRLIAYFKNEITQINPNGQLSEAFTYLIRHLSNPRSTIRLYAYKALCVIVTIDVDKYLQMLEDNVWPSLFTKESLDWFQMKLVPSMKSPQQMEALCDALTAALCEESNPLLICEYLDVIAKHIHKPKEILAINCSKLLIERKKIPKNILMYYDFRLKVKILTSIYKIFASYIESIELTSSNMGVHENYVHVKFMDQTKTIYINLNIVYGIILSLSYWDDFTDDNLTFDTFYNYLLNLFLTKTYPQLFISMETKETKPIAPEWLIPRLLTTRSQPIVTFIVDNVKIEQLIQFLDSYGLSIEVATKMLQSLDKLSPVESKVIKNMNLSDSTKQNLLENIQLYWKRGVVYGIKFAKMHLNYKMDNEDRDDEEMEDLSKKKDDKLVDSRPDFVSKKINIPKMFKEKDFDKILLLTRMISTELFDSNVKTKKMTKQFLNEFADSIEELTKEISKGTFNSIFNIIITSVLKDSKRYGLNTELTKIKASVNQADKSLKSSLFWKCYERFLCKESTQKTKKAKGQKKKSPSKSISTFDEEDLLEMFSNLKSSSKKSSDSDSWLDTYMDLAIEKYYKKDTDAENFNFKLIFSRNRPYFLLLLLHKSNFSTLNDCIRFILNEKSELNPTAVLDFLTICIDSPKLWIGRENDSQKTVKHEDVLNLNYKQIKVLIDYVIQENDIANRTDLILRTCCVNTLKTEMTIHCLKNYDYEFKNISSELYVRLYLQIPNIEFNKKVTDEDIILLQSLPSFMDKITHNLITSFMFVETNSCPVNQQLFLNWEYGMLKIASKHPLLFIRQLPMMPAMLRGKVNVVHYEVFKSLNLLRIFSKLLNILNLLRPYLWNRNIKGIEQILNLYLEMFISYYRLPRNKEPNHELFPLIAQFLRLIDDWNKYDHELANQWIKKHRMLLRELQSAYENEQDLFNSIISGLPLQDNASVMVASQHYQTLQMNLKRYKLPNELVMNTLFDINKMLDKLPSLGETFIHSIQSFYSNPSFTELSFTITLKVLQTDPSLAKTIISSYVKCLQNDSSHVTKNALRILPEFVLLAQDFRYLLLRKTFELAITGNSLATNALLDAFRALNSQIGC